MVGASRGFTTGVMATRAPVGSDALDAPALAGYGHRMSTSTHAARTAAGAVLALALGCATGRGAPGAPAAPIRTMDQILEASPAGDWRPLDPERTLQLELPGGRVVIELAPGFAPAHVANLRTLVRAGYFDGLAVVRVQDGFVAQWGDPLAGGEGARSLGAARGSLPLEVGRPAAGLPFTPLPDGDVYAPEVGFAEGFPVARQGPKLLRALP